ncbi:MAG: alpha/beta hydrolase [Acidobacteriota bacterium]
MGEFISANGISTYYELHRGREQPIVFVHGWSLDLESWRAQIDHFRSAGHTVLAYDWRGMGQTPVSPRPFDLSDLAHDLRALLHQLEIRKPVLCGHSQGGAIVLRHALYHRNEVSRIVLVDTALQKSLEDFLGSAYGQRRRVRHHAREAEPARRARAAFLHAAPRPGQTLNKTMAARRTLTSEERALDQEQRWLLEEMLPIISKMFWSKKFRTAKPPAYERWREQWLANDLFGLFEGILAWIFRRREANRLLRQFHDPALLYWGTKDKPISKEEMIELQERLGSRPPIYPLRGAGHNSMIEQPAEFNQRLRVFLNTMVTPEPSRRRYKKRYSRGARTVQRCHRRQVVASRRIAHAVAKAMERYLYLQAKSAVNDVDGALLNCRRNYHRACRTFLTKSRRACRDVERACLDMWGW